MVVMRNRLCNWPGGERQDDVVLVQGSFSKNWMLKQPQFPQLLRVYSVSL